MGGNEAKLLLLAELYIKLARPMLRIRRISYSMKRLKRMVLLHIVSPKKGHLYTQKIINWSNANLVLMSRQLLFQSMCRVMQRYPLLLYRRPSLANWNQDTVKQLRNNKKNKNSILDHKLLKIHQQDNYTRAL
jgi:hypothetical protein